MLEINPPCRNFAQCAVNMAAVLVAQPYPLAYMEDGLGIFFHNYLPTDARHWFSVVTLPAQICSEV